MLLEYDEKTGRLVAAVTNQNLITKFNYIDQAKEKADELHQIIFRAQQRLVQEEKTIQRHQLYRLLQQRQDRRLRKRLEIKNHLVKVKILQKEIVVKIRIIKVLKRVVKLMRIIGLQMKFYPKRKREA